MRKLRERRTSLGSNFFLDLFSGKFLSIRRKIDLYLALEYLSIFSCKKTEQEDQFPILVERTLWFLMT